MITMDTRHVKMALAICNKSMDNSITQHSLRFWICKILAKRWSLAGKYNYIISKYLEEFTTENVVNLVVGA